MSGITTRRSLTYWLVFLTFLLAGGPIMTSPLMLGEFFHNILDGVSAFTAIIATVMAFMAYRRTRATALIVVAHAFAAAAVLELLHELADSRWMQVWIVSDPENFMPWSWHASRMFLSLGLLAAALHASNDNYGAPLTQGRSHFPSPLVLSVVIGVALPITIYGLIITDLPSIYYSSVGLFRIPDILSGAVFFAALVLFVRKGNWRTDSYGHWLNLALVFSVGSQFFFMAFSQEFLDSSFGAAHLIKVLSYMLVIYGFSTKHGAIIQSEEELQDKPRGLGLGVKVAVVCGFIGVICVIPIAIYSSGNLHSMGAANGMEKLSTAAANTSRELEDSRRRIGANLENLANSKSLIDSVSKAESSIDVASSDQGYVKSVQLIGENLLASESRYMSIAYLDVASGEVLTRVEQSSDVGLAQANRLTLQESEFLLSNQLLKGIKRSSITRSKILRLNGEVAGTDNVLAEGVAVAVYGEGDGEPIGILIAHTDITNILTSIPLLNAETKLYVVNSDGQFLNNAEMETLSSADRINFGVAEQFPGVEFIESENPNIPTGATVKEESGHELLLGFKEDAAYAVSGEPLLYIYAASRVEIEAAATAIGEDLQRIAQINLLIAIAIGWFFARRISKPVQSISKAAVEFGRSGQIKDIPYKGYDEIGLLAKSLSGMMNEVSSQRNKLLLLSSAVESSVESMLITSIHGSIEYVNPEYERYAGVVEAELLAKNIMELPEFVENRHILSKEQATKGSELVWVGELRTRRADGQFHDEVITISPIRNAAGEQINQSLIIEDVTARKAMERYIEMKTEELQRSNHDLEQFAYVASHDLKAPLRAIEVLVSWLKDDLEEFEGGDVHENLDFLEQRTSRLARLLDDLLEYSRAGRKNGGVKSIDSREFVEDIATLLAPPEGFVIEADDSLPSIVTHHAPLETVFRNLLSNAVKHSPDPSKGRIRVSAIDKGPMVEFVVEDNGTGIPQEYADKVFKMFQTLKARDEMEGSGMGLAIVKRIVDWQQGDIWFHEGPDNVGTVFRFTWSKTPVDMPEMDEPDTADAPEVSTEQSGEEAQHEHLEETGDQPEVQEGQPEVVD
jgi:PAS domain S-box-containing protein